MTDGGIGGIDDEVGEEMFADLGRFEPGAIPVEAVLRQGKAIRLRRRLVGGGALALAAVLVFLAPTALRATDPAAGAASGTTHSISVDAPWQDDTGQQIFAGTIDGKQWLYARKARCLGPETRCMDLVGDVLPPVSLLAEKTKDGNLGVSAEFGRDTDHALITLERGEQFTIKALPVLTRNTVMIRSTYFELPRGARVADIAAYRADGSRIGNVDPGPLRSDVPLRVSWHDPDGQVIPLVGPFLQLAQGGSGQAAWTVSVSVGDYVSEYVYDDGRMSSIRQQDSGLRIDMMTGRSRAAVLYGEVDSRTARVQVRFDDGTTVSVAPVTADGRSFVAAAAPFGVNIADAVPYDAAGAVVPGPSIVRGGGSLLVDTANRGP